MDPLLSKNIIILMLTSQHPGIRFHIVEPTITQSVFPKKQIRGQKNTPLKFNKLIPKMKPFLKPEISIFQFSIILGKSIRQTFKESNPVHHGYIPRRKSPTELHGQQVSCLGIFCADATTAILTSLPAIARALGKMLNF